jgi:tetraacyldisaccharide 4'-kinase
MIGRTGLILQEDRLPDGLPGTLLKTGLAAASWCYGAGHLSRLAAYRLGVLKTKKLPFWTLSVGNLTAGGTGKTPVVLALAQSIASRGRKVAILSRGYGGQAPGPVTVISDGERIFAHPPEAADEAYMLSLRLPGVAVLTGPDRYALGKKATDLGVEVAILDDGFQHVQLARDLNLLLLDAEKPFGNGYLLPRGTLREPKSAVARAQGVLLTRSQTPEPDLAVWLQREYPALPVAVSRFVPDGVFDISSSQKVPFEEKRVFLVCGIARPKDFQKMAQEAGFEEAGILAFPDHCDYSPAAVAQAQEQARACGAAALLTTEKDAVKLRPFITDGLPWGVLRIRLEVLSGAPLWEAWTRGPG